MAILRLRTAVAEQSWVNGLYDLFKADNCSVQLINGDTNGFSSAHEMMMLIRDGILLRPSLVISLSGFYNFAYNTGLVEKKQYAEILKDYPFTNLRQLEYYGEFIPRFGLGNDKIHYGEKVTMSPWTYWVEHAKIINGLCSEFGINHMTFLQPCVFSQNYNASQNEVDTLAKLYGITNNDVVIFERNFG